MELMTMNHVPEQCIPLRMGVPLPGYGFGLGFAVMMDVAQSACLGSVGEYRWGGAASTAFWIDPKEEIIGLLLTQFMPSNHYPVRQEFKSLMYQALVD